MNLIVTSIITVLSLPLVFSCSLPPGTRFYSPTERTILAPVVFYARVLNTTVPDDSPGQIFDACVRVQRTFKSPLAVPRELCFGTFGIEELCLTYVFKGDDYVFFLNENLKARYDGFPASAIPATSETVAAVERGYCRVQTSSPGRCDPPLIIQEESEVMTRVVEGQTTYINCKATGTPPLVVTWYRGGELVTDKQRGNVLVMVDTTVYDAGRYTCTVKNPAGEATVEYQVQTLSSSCGQTIGVKENVSEIIESPDFPRPYRRAKACSWRVCPPLGMHLEFSFTTFDLRTFDKLEIINECDQQHFAWRQYCGSKVSPGTFVSRCQTSCMQIILDSGILTNRVATGFQAVVKATNKESSEVNLSEVYCKSTLVAKVKPTIEFVAEFNAEVLEVFKQDQPLPLDEEISMNYDFTVTDMFGCSLRIKVDTEYYVFASYEESDDVENAGKYAVNFAVNPTHHNAPANFVQQLNLIRDAPPRCESLPA